MVPLGRNVTTPRRRYTCEEPEHHRLKESPRHLPVGLFVCRCCLLIWKDVMFGDQGLTDCWSVSSTKLVRWVPSWVWLITSNALPVVMLAMRLTFCWLVYIRKGDKETLAIAAAVIAPRRSALSRRYRSHRIEGSQPTSIPKIT